MRSVYIDVTTSQIGDRINIPRGIVVVVVVMPVMKMGHFNKVRID